MLNLLIRYVPELNLTNPSIIQVPAYQEVVFHEKQHRYCLLIPLFNEKKYFFKQITKMRERGVFNMVDVIICDAGSSDGCTDPQILESNGFTALLIRAGNGRYSTDMRMGYSWAINNEYEGFISVDGNDKDDTSAIVDFIKKLDEGYDYIQGSRYVPGGKAIRTPLIRAIALKLINEPVMTFCAGRRLTDTTNGFRAYSRKFLQDRNLFLFRNIFWGYELIYYLPVMACKMGYKVIEIPVTRAYPESGEVPTKIGGFKGNLYQISILWHMIKKDYEC